MVVFVSGDVHWAEFHAKRMPASSQWGPSQVPHPHISTVSTHIYSIWSINSIFIIYIIYRCCTRSRPRACPRIGPASGSTLTGCGTGQRTRGGTACTTGEPWLAGSWSRDTWSGYSPLIGRRCTGSADCPSPTTGSPTRSARKVGAGPLITAPLHTSPQLRARRPPGAPPSPPPPGSTCPASGGTAPLSPWSWPSKPSPTQPKLVPTAGIE